MPYLDIYVDDDQLSRVIVEEIDFALAEDREMNTDTELRRAMMLVRNYFCNQSELVQKSFPFMYDEQDMTNGLSI